MGAPAQPWSRARSTLLGGTLLAAALGTAAAAPDGQRPTASGQAAGAAGRKAAAEAYLRHVYAVYLGIRACSEISAQQNDRSFLSEVSVDEARRTLRLIDAAAREVGLDPAGTWGAAAPLATVTAEALKRDPPHSVEYCQRMGSLFRTDAGNLQADLTMLGARTLVIPKDY